jgi:hypothetical protein
MSIESGGASAKLTAKTAPLGKPVCNMMQRGMCREDYREIEITANCVQVTQDLTGLTSLIPNQNARVESHPYQQRTVETCQVFHLI